MAEIELPQRRPGALGRVRVPATVTAGDVPQVQMAPDPGVRVPAAAFGADIGAAMQDVGKAGMDLAHTVRAEADRQQKLYDATHTAEAELAFDRAGMDELRRRQADDSFQASEPNFMTDYEEWLVGTRDRDGSLQFGGTAQRIIDGLPPNVSPEARDRLKIALERRASGMVDAAGRLSLKAGQDKALGAIDGLVNEWSAQAERDPDRADGILADAKAKLHPFAATIGRGVADRATAQAQAAIVAGKIGGLVVQQRFDDATAALDGAPDKILGADQRRQLTDVIAAGRRQQRIDVDLADRIARQAKADAQKATASAFVNRMTPAWLAANPGSKALTAIDVANSNLDAPQKASFQNALEAASQDRLKTDSAMLGAVALGLGAGEIDVANFNAKVLPLLGDGLDIDAFKAAEGWARTLAGTAEKPRIDAFFKKAYELITGQPAARLGDSADAIARARARRGSETTRSANAQRRFADFWRMASGKIVAAIRNGTPLSDLLDRDSKTYLGRALVPGQGFVPAAIAPDDLRGRSKPDAPPPPSAPGISLSLPKSITHQGKTLEVTGGSSDGSYRVRDPDTGATGTYRP